MPPRAAKPEAEPGASPSNAEILARRRLGGSTSETLLLCDFDNTLTDYDAGGGMLLVASLMAAGAIYSLCPFQDGCVDLKTKPSNCSHIFCWWSLLPVEQKVIGLFA